MIEQIRRCQKCGLCFNQKPLLDVEKECQVFWVGLSAKKKKSNKEIPLSPETNTRGLNSLFAGMRSITKCNTR